MFFILIQNIPVSLNIVDKHTFTLFLNILLLFWQSRLGLLFWKGLYDSCCCDANDVKSYLKRFLHAVLTWKPKHGEFNHRERYWWPGKECFITLPMFWWFISILADLVTLRTEFPLTVRKLYICNYFKRELIEHVLQPWTVQSQLWTGSG